MPSFAFGLLTWFQALASSATSAPDGVEIRNDLVAHRETYHRRAALTITGASGAHQSPERRVRASAQRTPTDGTLATDPAFLPDLRPGVGIMLLNEHDRVFVGRRIRVVGKAWQMPQGGIDDSEDPLVAALRELREEIGTDNVEVLAESDTWLRYELPPALIGKAWQGRWRGQQQKWFAMRYLGCDTDINIATKHQEFSAWRWVAASELPEMIVSFKRQIYLDVLEQFRTIGSGSPAPGRAATSRSVQSEDNPHGHRRS